MSSQRTNGLKSSKCAKVENDLKMGQIAANVACLVRNSPLRLLHLHSAPGLSHPPQALASPLLAPIPRPMAPASSGAARSREHARCAPRGLRSRLTTSLHRGGTVAHPADEYGGSEWWHWTPGQAAGTGGQVCPPLRDSPAPASPRQECLCWQSGRWQAGLELLQSPPTIHLGTGCRGGPRDQRSHLCPVSLSLLPGKCKARTGQLISRDPLGHPAKLARP